MAGSMADAMNAAAKGGSTKKTVVDDAAADGGKKKKKGKGKVGVRVKMQDAKKATLVVQKQGRPDGSFLVKVVHTEKEGADAKTGMVTTHATDADATKKQDEIVALAEKQGWKRVASLPKALKSEFATLPVAAK